MNLIQRLQMIQRLQRENNFESPVAQGDQEPLQLSLTTPHGCTNQSDAANSPKLEA